MGGTRWCIRLQITWPWLQAPHTSKMQPLSPSTIPIQGVERQGYLQQGRRSKKKTMHNLNTRFFFFAKELYFSCLLLKFSLLGDFISGTQICYNFIKSQIWRNDSMVNLTNANPSIPLYTLWCCMAVLAKAMITQVHTLSECLL